MYEKSVILIIKRHLSEAIYIAPTIKLFRRLLWRRTHFYSKVIMQFISNVLIKCCYQSASEFRQIKIRVPSLLERIRDVIAIADVIEFHGNGVLEISENSILFRFHRFQLRWWWWWRGFSSPTSLRSTDRRRIDIFARWRHRITFRRDVIDSTRLRSILPSSVCGSSGIFHQVVDPHDDPVTAAPLLHTSPTCGCRCIGAVQVSLNVLIVGGGGRRGGGCRVMICASIGVRCYGAVDVISPSFSSTSSSFRLVLLRIAEENVSVEFASSQTFFGWWLWLWWWWSTVDDWNEVRIDVRNIWKRNRKFFWIFFFSSSSSCFSSWVSLVSFSVDGRTLLFVEMRLPAFFFRVFPLPVASENQSHCHEEDERKKSADAE